MVLLLIEERIGSLEIGAHHLQSDGVKCVQQNIINLFYTELNTEETIIKSSREAQTIFSTVTSSRNIPGLHGRCKYALRGSCLLGVVVHKALLDA